MRRNTKARLFGRAFSFYPACVLLVLTACATPQKRAEKADSLIAQNQYQSEILQTSTYRLFWAAPARPSRLLPDTLTVVIEGDGYAWVDLWTPSDNPTPRDPSGLRLALAHADDPLYLARPCQFTVDPRCTVHDWTDGRFSAPILQSYTEALDRLKSRFKADHFHLIGYSGGAYIALVMAGQRADIQKVTTVAGLLDPDAWTAHLEVTPLQTPSPPESLIRRSAQTDFIHYCGEEDEILPCSLAQDFMWRAQSLGLGNHRVVPLADTHHETIVQARAVLR